MQTGYILLNQYEEEVQNLIGSISLLVGVRINFTDKIGTLIDDSTLRGAFGKKCKYQDEFITFVKDAYKLT